MGAVTSKDRYDRAAATGILTLNKEKIKSWSKLIKPITKLPKLRTITVSHNPLKDSVPHSFTTLSCWATLVSLDLSHNGLTCACALGSEAPLSKSHVEEVETRITTAPVAGSAGATVPTAYPLESLNISGNDLHLLPPLLASRFPRLRRLVCTDNDRRLAIPVTLAACLGRCANLEVVALQRNQLTEFHIADDTVEKPFPALCELLLDQNHLSGIVNLGFAADKTAPLVPSLRRITLDEQIGKEALRQVDPCIFVHCSGLNSLSLRGNCYEEEVQQELGKSESYRYWQANKKDVVDKKLHAGGAADLI